MRGGPADQALPRAVPVEPKASRLARSSTSVALAAVVEHPLTAVELSAVVLDCIVEATEFYQASKLEAAIDAFRICAAQYYQSHDRLLEAVQLDTTLKRRDKCTKYHTLLRIFDDLLSSLKVQVKAAGLVVPDYEYFLYFQYEHIFGPKNGRTIGWRFVPYVPRFYRKAAYAAGTARAPNLCTQWFHDDAGNTGNDDCLDVLVLPVDGNLFVRTTPPAEFDGVYVQDITVNAPRGGERPVYRRLNCSFTKKELGLIEDERARRLTERQTSPESCPAGGRRPRFNRLLPQRREEAEASVAQR